MIHSEQLPPISFRSNAIKFGKLTLGTDNITPSALGKALAHNKHQINQHIEKLYKKTRQNHAPKVEVTRPSLLVLPLGKSALNLSHYGQLNATNRHRHPIEITPEIRPYWEAVQSAEFTPEIRGNMGKRGNPQETALFIRNPETDLEPVTPLEHLPVALGFVEPVSTQSYGSYQELLDWYQDAGEEAVKKQGITHGDEAYALAQIGFIIAAANMRVRNEGNDFALHPARYRSALQDASSYAYHRGFTEVDEIIRQEMERIITHSELIY